MVGILATALVVAYVRFPGLFTKVPKSVQADYKEVAAKYAKSLGSSLLKCNSDQGMIFVVSGSGGFTGISNYFDLNGNKIGSYESTDMVFGDTPKPPVEVDYNSCKTLKIENQPEHD